MKKNNIKKWNVPLNDFPNTIYVDGLHDDYEGFRILVRGGEPSRVYRISFDSYYLGYRNFDESERLKFIQSFPLEIEDWCLFKASESNFIDWIVDQSHGIQSNEKVTHFIIITPNDIVEVLCLKEPKIEKL